MKVLFLTYYFPPLGGAGVQRALKFAKYLPEFGVTPVVICADEPGYVSDPSLLAEIPNGMEVHRLQHTPLLTHLVSAVRGMRPARPEGPGISPGTHSRPAWRDIAIRGYQALQVPDDKRGWGKKAYLRAAALIEQQGIDIIFSSSPPITSHVVAAKLKKRFRIPWVADFRDLWTTNPAYGAPTWREKIDRRLERHLLDDSDGITVVSENMAAALGSSCTGKKVHFLPNGYDEADFMGIAPSKTTGDRFVLLHMGTLYAHQSPEGVLQAARRYFEKCPDGARRLCLRFIGNIGARFEPLFDAFESAYPGVVERIPYIRHSEVPRELMGADALLLLIGGGIKAKGVLTGKLFEYLRAGRPILLLGPADGEAARLLAETGHGVSRDESDISGIAEALEQMTTVENHGCFPADDPSITCYERREQTRRLAGYFRQIKERGAHV